MTGDCHVRCCESRGLKRPRPLDGLAVVERQAPAENAPQSGMSTVVLGAQGAPTPVAARACGTR